MILSTITNTELQVKMEEILGKKGFPPTTNHHILYSGVPVPLSMKRNLNAHFSLSVMATCCGFLFFFVFFSPKAPMSGTYTNY